MIGKTISRYKILALLGRGGMGEVYLAEDTELERKAALKFLPPQYISDPELKARFKREARAAASLNHPNIITIYDIGEHQNRAWMAMELVDGESLRDLMARREPEIGEALDIMMQACEGLGEAHRAGIIHRDIKPANILLNRQGRVKIADFGLARIAGGTPLTKESLIMGTPAYMSPEQARGKRLDARSDIFSLGIVLYELLTARLPFKGDNELALFEAIKNQQPEPLARYKAGVSPGLQRIIDKALDKELETRYRSAEDLLVDLKREKRQLLQPTATIIAPPVQNVKKPFIQPPPPEIKPRRSNRRPLLIAAAALVVIVFIYWVVQNWSTVPDESATPVKKPALTASDSLYLKYKDGGDAFLGRNDFENAKRQYRLALQQKPDDRYATAWMDSCDQRSARRKILAQREKDYAQYVKDGNDLYQNKRYEEAKRKFEEALKEKPDDGYAAARKEACDERIKERLLLYTKFKDTANTFFTQGKYAEAITAYEQAREYATDDSYVSRRIQECNRFITAASRKTEPVTETAPARTQAAPEGMVRIPAGSFMMGSDDGESDEKPVHEVYVDAFYMDKNEVTVAQYQLFLKATNRQQPEQWSEQLQYPKRPVVYVSWEDATEYCNWRSRTAGGKYRLPTEAEWEYASRGGFTGMGGKPKYKYPWGDDASASKANFDVDGKRGYSWEEAKLYLKDVGSYPANGYGLNDMAGNVWEWCADWYASDYYQNSSRQNPKGPSTGSNRVLRGGSWSGGAQDCRSAFRTGAPPAYRGDNVGFRLVLVP